MGKSWLTASVFVKLHSFVWFSCFVSERLLLWRNVRRRRLVVPAPTAPVSRQMISPALNMLLLLLLLSLTVSYTLLLSCKSLHRCYLRLYVWLQDGGHAQRVSGQRSNGSCVCEVNSGTWSFPVGKFEAVLQQVHSCEGTLNNLQKKVKTLSASVFIPFTERVNHQVFLMHRSS